MIDPKIERQFSDCKELIAHWQAFHDFLIMGTRGENITPEKEEQFLLLKSKIAMLHDSFMEALTTDQNIGQEVLNIITRAITLRHLNKQSIADTKKMEIEWHESFLLLNQTIGALEDKRNELSQINEAQFRAKKAAGEARQKITFFLNSTGFKLSVAAIIILFATVGVQYLGIYDYNQLGNSALFRTPFQMGKRMYQKMIDADSAWPSIDSVPRKPQASWPPGIKEPEIKGDSKEPFLQKMTALGLGPFAAKLASAQEYRKEVTHKEFKGDIEIHSFRMNATSDAKAAWDEWEKATGSHGSEKVKEKIAVVRETNLIWVVFCDDPQLLNDVRVNVFDQK